MEKTSFPPFSTLIWRSWIQKNARADFPISLPSQTICSLLPRTFFLLFLLPLVSLRKFLTLTWTITVFLIFLFYPSTLKPRLDNFPARACYVGTKKVTEWYLDRRLPWNLWCCWHGTGYPWASEASKQPSLLLPLLVNCLKGQYQ